MLIAFFLRPTKLTITSSSTKVDIPLNKETELNLALYGFFWFPKLKIYPNNKIFRDALTNEKLIGISMLNVKGTFEKK